MAKEPIVSIEVHFSNITDPRGPNITHQLFDIIVFAILGTIHGADSWVEIEKFGYQTLNWGFSQFVGCVGVIMIRH